MRQTLTGITLLVVIVLVSGCAAMQAKSQLKNYSDMLNPILGVATKRDITARFGMPTRTASIGNGEVWEFHQSFGIRGGFSSYTPQSPNAYGPTYTHGQSREVYDKVTLIFDENGILQNWRAYVQR